MKPFAFALGVAVSLVWGGAVAEAHGPYGWGPRPAVGFYFNPVVPAPYYVPPPVPRAYGYWAPPPPPPMAPVIVARPTPGIGLYIGS
jgi:hypothetical protein